MAPRTQQHLILLCALMVGAAMPAFAQTAPDGAIPALPALSGGTPPALAPLDGNAPAATSKAPAPIVSPTALTPLQLPASAAGSSAPPAGTAQVPALAPNAMVPPSTVTKTGALPQLSLPASSGAEVKPVNATPDNSAMPAMPQSNNPYPTAATPTAPADKPAVVYSYGNSNVSILFMPEQIEKMKDAIRSYEMLKAQGKAAAPTFVGVSSPTVVPQVIPEPKGYPVFYLSSIVYRAPGDWSLWISGHKITAAKNRTDVHVMHVSADSATFTWKPTYDAALRKRKADKLFAPTVPVKNKLSTSQQIGFDDASGLVTFTLHPNQSFAVGYFANFEGYIDTPELDPLATAPSTAINIPATPGAPGNPNVPGVAAPTSTNPTVKLRPATMPAAPVSTNPAASAAQQPPVQPQPNAGPILPATPTISIPSVRQ